MVRSKSKNISAFSWALRPVLVHPVGKGLDGVETSVLPPLTWISVKTISPHWLFAGAPIGVLNEKYWDPGETTPSAAAEGALKELPRALGLNTSQG